MLPSSFYFCSNSRRQRHPRDHRLSLSVPKLIPSTIMTLDVAIQSSSRYNFNLVDAFPAKTPISTAGKRKFPNVHLKLAVLWLNLKSQKNLNLLRIFSKNHHFVFIYAWFVVKTVIRRRSGFRKNSGIGFFPPPKNKTD